MKARASVEVDKDDVMKVFDVEEHLMEAGIYFDSGMGIPQVENEEPAVVRDWELDGIGGMKRIWVSDDERIMLNPLPERMKLVEKAEELLDELGVDIDVGEVEGVRYWKPQSRMRIMEKDK